MWKGTRENLVPFSIMVISMMAGMDILSKHQIPEKTWMFPSDKMLFICH
jgi:hypothetical protein